MEAFNALKTIYLLNKIRKHNFFNIFFFNIILTILTKCSLYLSKILFNFYYLPLKIAIFAIIFNLSDVIRKLFALYFSIFEIKDLNKQIFIFKKFYNIYIHSKVFFFQKYIYSAFQKWPRRS